MKYEYLNDDYWPDIYWPKHYWPYGLPLRQLKGSIVHDLILMGILNQAATVLVGLPIKDTTLLPTELHRRGLSGAITITQKLVCTEVMRLDLAGQIITGE